MQGARSRRDVRGTDCDRSEVAEAPLAMYPRSPQVALLLTRIRTLFAPVLVTIWEDAGILDDVHTPAQPERRVWGGAHRGHAERRMAREEEEEHRASRKRKGDGGLIPRLTGFTARSVCRGIA